ncbi:hypothetical protein [Gordonia sp. i37]|uniref:hypothetical protein n=1 Tax=Gordonia sp. i37 TaxID=1961707 RepID=UPI0009ADD32C|nr:hypothetical protein [Gordonia sp. i37]OPX15837.1 hypothetical protein B1964_07855 [Gordonia sp. i37]
MTAVIGPDEFTNGYQSAVDTLAEIPGPLLSALIPKLLAVAPDPDDDALYDAGFRQALRDTAGGDQ